MDRKLGLTKRKILILLRKSGSLTVNMLANELSISPMGVRQHLLALEKNEMVNKKLIRKTIGRPFHSYSLTDKTDDLFPKAYINFIKGVLSDFRQYDGDDMIELILSRRCQRHYNLLDNRINQKKLIDRVRALLGTINDFGNFAEIKPSKKNIQISVHNCPIYQIAKDYPRICSYDKKLITSLLKADVELTKTLASGDSSCEYIIDKDSYRS